MLEMRDSNPRSRDQNPLPYRLANLQYISKFQNSKKQVTNKYQIKKNF